MSLLDACRALDVNSVSEQVNDQNVNVPDSNGYTPLILTLMNGVLQSTNANAAQNAWAIVRLLLARGANPNTRTLQGQKSALHFAAELGQTDIVRELINAGAEINARTKKGYTPLNSAAYFENTQATLYLLIQCGAAINMANNIDFTVTTGGQITPLHNAIKEGQFDNIRILLNAGANIRLKTQNNYSIIELVEHIQDQSKKSQIANFLGIETKATKRLDENLYYYNKGHYPPDSIMCSNKIRQIEIEIENTRADGLKGDSGDFVAARSALDNLSHTLPTLKDKGFTPSTYDKQDLLKDHEAEVNRLLDKIARGLHLHLHQSNAPSHSQQIAPH